MWAHLAAHRWQDMEGNIAAMIPVIPVTVLALWWTSLWGVRASAVRHQAIWASVNAPLSISVAINVTCHCVLVVVIKIMVPLMTDTPVITLCAHPSVVYAMLHVKGGISMPTILQMSLTFAHGSTRYALASTCHYDIIIHHN